MTLDDLAIKYGSDKSWRVHNFTRIYECHFEGMRDRPLRLLEIGSGASVQMWRDYFPHATIVGIDNAEGVPRSAGVDVVIGDQGDPDFLGRFAAKYEQFDIIIDDGSHTWADQILSLHLLFPIVSPGGLYAIEDLQTSYWPAYAKGTQTTMQYLQGKLDELNCWGKNGYGVAKNDPNYEETRAYETEMARWIECFEFYKSMVVIRKKAAP